MYVLSPAGKSVEFWLDEVEAMMKLSIKDTLLRSIGDYRVTSRKEWVLYWIGQCVLNESQFYWTREVEEALRAEGAEGLRKYYEFPIVNCWIYIYGTWEDDCVIIDDHGRIDCVRCTRT